MYATSCYNTHTFKSDINILINRCSEIKNNIELKDCYDIINKVSFIYNHMLEF